MIRRIPVRALRFLSRGEHKLMVMLRAYCDASGKSDNPNDVMVTIGGVVSSLEQWEQFEPEWSAMLDSFDITELHMKYLAHCRGEYEGWDESKRRSFLGHAVEIMDRHWEGYMGATMPIEVFDSLEAAHKEKLVDPYFPCFFANISGLMTCADHLGPEEKVEMTVEGEPGFMGKATEFWERARNEGPPGFRERLGTLTVGASSREVLPLQVADLVAYEVNKHLSSEYMYRQHGKPLPTKWPRWTFNQIKKRMLTGEIIDREIVGRMFGI